MRQPTILITNDNYQTFVDREFYSSDVVTIAAGNTKYVLGRTPANSYIFIGDRSIKAISDNQAIDVDIKLYEDATVTADGTPVAIFNNNRNGVRIPNFQIFDGPTVSDVGTDIGRGNRIKAAKGEAGSSNEREPYMMKQDSDYLLEIVNNETTPITVLIFWSWFENEQLIAGG